MFAALHIADFPLQAVLRAEPGLPGKPVVVVTDDPRSPRVLAATPAVRAAGVEPGWSVPRAQARCPDLVVRLRQPALEREAGAALLAVAFTVSPRVEPTAPGLCTASLAGLPPARHHPALAAALPELAALGLAAAAGIGATPLLAFHAARAAAPGTVRAADRAFLAALPLAAADPTPEHAAILAGWGLRTLGDLTALSPADVARRLGREGRALWERAAGGTARPLRLAAPARAFAARLDCEHELETLEPVLFLLRRLLDRLAHDLRNAHLAALGLELELFLADERRHTRVIRLPTPVTDPELLFRALHTHLGTVQTSAAVTGVGLRLQPGRGVVQQQGLFDGGLRDAHGFADTLARLAALVGADRAGRPVRLDTHRPDAFRLEPPPATLTPLPDGFVPPPRGLPLRRHRPPRPATVELAGATPAFLWTPAVHGPVKAAAGPWRGSGDWWRPDAAWEREEWDVELTPGGLYRLLRTPAGWFVEGEYD